MLSDTFHTSPGTTCALTTSCVSSSTDRSSKAESTGTKKVFLPGRSKGDIDPGRERTRREKWEMESWKKKI